MSALLGAESQPLQSGFPLLGFVPDTRPLCNLCFILFLTVLRTLIWKTLRSAQ